jgi:xanthine dehydrogenase accessory factor
VPADPQDVARLLDGRGEPYALATVVWRRSPSSGKVGARALITADGRIYGWLGGACAEPAVVAEARRAIADRQPRLMFLGRPDELPMHQRDGVVSVPIACQSEGALEVYVEPVMPKPSVVVIGRSPAVDALARMGQALGWRAMVVDDQGHADDHAGIVNVLTSLDLTSVGSDSFVVVATQGHYDEDALERALETPARYVGLVASRKRADAVLGYLRDRGVAEDQVARVHAPAGLDLGSVSNEEIAVAILAELVQLRAAGGVVEAEPPPSPETHEAIDPVCGMTVQIGTARHRATHDGRTYYFCSAGCRAEFESNPPAYVKAEAEAP